MLAKGRNNKIGRKQIDQFNMEGSQNTRHRLERKLRRLSKLQKQQNLVRAILFSKT